jgi:hypothetical protein
MGRGRDLVHRAIERGLIGLGWLREPAHLADELERGGAHLVLAGGRGEIEQRADVPAHEVLGVRVCGRW